MTRLSQLETVLLLLLLMAASSVDTAQTQQIKIGAIEFFGVGDVSRERPRAKSKGQSEEGPRAKGEGQSGRGQQAKAFSREDLERLRRALPIKEGDELNLESVDATRGQIRQAVRQTTGSEATDVNFLCCDERGGALIFIGLPGRAFRPFRYSPAPRGKARLPTEIVRLAERADGLAAEAAQREPREDRSQGYSLSLYPPLREVQMRIRAYALRHAKLLRRVISTAADAKQRQVAAYALGHAPQSRAQMVALAKAARDSSSAVRNDATRALGVIAQSSPALAAQIPAVNFVAMLSSGTWSDRNKSAFLVSVLTARRDPALLSLLRRQALEALIEMARWRDARHATDARMILGRVAGFEEQQLVKLVSEGKVEEIVEAVGSKQ